jgi:phage terminase large subunit-like protein
VNGATPPLFALLRLYPNWLDTLTPAEMAVLPYMHDLWLRPEQYVPPHDWRYCGAIAGRGYGKTLGMAVEINRRAESGVRAFACMAPTEARVDAVQFANLISTAPPWFRPERFRDRLVWPNGAQALCFTPNEPERSRSENIDTSWVTEIVDWPETTMMPAFQTLGTATRIGHAQVFWDTTSMGANEVIAHLMALHAEDPYTYPVIRGSTFDNPLLTRKYILSECRKYSGQRFEEELMGRVFAEGEGAQFKKEWLVKHRRDAAPLPSEVVLTLVSVDPALTGDSDSDEVGYVLGQRTRDGHAHVLEDRTKHMSPEDWGDQLVQDCLDYQATGCIIERKRVGDFATALVRSRAAAKKLTVRLLDAHEPWPRYTKGVIYVRERSPQESKIRRADGPASECELGNVHHVGVFPKLEKQLLTYSGKGRSPNQFDAYTQLITELRDLDRETKKAPAVVTAEAKRAHESVRDQLRSIGRGRVV